jgi:hypothetical protein
MAGLRATKVRAPHDLEDAYRHACVSRVTGLAQFALVEVIDVPKVGFTGHCYAAKVVQTWRIIIGCEAVIGGNGLKDLGAFLISERHHTIGQAVEAAFPVFAELIVQISNPGFPLINLLRTIVPFVTPHVDDPFCSWLFMIISNEADQLPLGVSVAFNVPLGRGQRPMARKFLHVAK